MSKLKQCDLIMKGGVTSGVVYPQAIMEISKEYRLRSIGGTSAGSMAAALAAAAEHYRQKNGGDDAGFKKFASVDGELATGMGDMLQPSPALAPLFEIGLDILKHQGLPKGAVAQLAALRRYYKTLAPYREQEQPRASRNGLTLFGGSVLGSFAVGGPALAGAGAIGGVLLYLVQNVISTARNIQSELVAHDFGVLPGTSQRGHDGKAVIDWLADRIDDMAGLWTETGAPEKPLTCGALDEADVELAAITTDLTAQRPFQLPLKVPGQHYFREEEMNAVIPPRVVRWMMSLADGREIKATIDGKSETLYPLPTGDDFPVILLTRMSMSFPGLIQAVPLWRYDRGTDDWVRCLFSDGGISSNLPVHMFDAWLPGKPTFAISLDRYDPTRHGKDADDLDNRVHFSGKKPEIFDLPPVKITGILSFVKYMFYSAKDWQDKLQSKLTGFNERVATIRLTEEQGGLNLDMDEKEVKVLQSYGKYAGQKMVSEFEFDENRLRRALSILPVVGENLQRINKVLDAPVPNGNGPVIRTYREVLEHHVSTDFPQEDGWQQDVLLAFAQALADVGALGITEQLKDGNRPHTDAKLSLTATPDLTEPKGTGQAPATGNSPQIIS